uniref:Temporin-1Ce n=1 Tax=Lithobates clamitans TaxID=145282 RepID=TP1E_LITCL|nr:RecName: Full=Temporin-1Ce [Lithobates clamitans]
FLPFLATLLSKVL